jgi:agmatinase
LDGGHERAAVLLVVVERRAQDVPYEPFQYGGLIGQPATRGVLAVRHERLAGVGGLGDRPARLPERDGQRGAGGGRRDIAANPYDIREAISTVEESADGLLGSGTRLVTIGGDHTIALPLLRAVARRHGPVALLHFDAHLDTWDTYFGAAYTHGTPFRRAVEEGVLDTSALSHVGIRGPLYGRADLDDDARMGFGIVTAADVMRRGVDEVAQALRERIGNRPLYVSVDIDVLDPAHAPGTGTPEAGGLTSRELLEILRGLDGTRLASADVVEVAPAYDHADITSVAASHVAYDLVSLMVRPVG